jgi:hypothetical protein
MCLIQNVHNRSAWGAQYIQGFDAIEAVVHFYVFAAQPTFLARICVGDFYAA